MPWGKSSDDKGSLMQMKNVSTSPYLGFGSPFFLPGTLCDTRSLAPVSAFFYRFLVDDRTTGSATVAGGYVYVFFWFWGRGGAGVGRFLGKKILYGECGRIISLLLIIYYSISDLLYL